MTIEERNTRLDEIKAKTDSGNYSYREFVQDIKNGVITEDVYEEEKWARLRGVHEILKESYDAFRSKWSVDTEKDQEVLEFLLKACPEAFFHVNTNATIRSESCGIKRFKQDNNFAVSALLFCSDEFIKIQLLRFNKPNRLGFIVELLTHRDAEWVANLYQCKDNSKLVLPFDALKDEETYEYQMSVLEQIARFKKGEIKFDEIPLECFAEEYVEVIVEIVKEKLTQQFEERTKDLDENTDIGSEEQKRLLEILNATIEKFKQKIEEQKKALAELQQAEAERSLDQWSHMQELSSKKAVLVSKNDEILAEIARLQAMIENNNREIAQIDSLIDTTVDDGAFGV